MPGSPYFDEVPRGILTWPKLLKYALPVTAVVMVIGWQNDILVELILVLTCTLFISAALRK